MLCYSWLLASIPLKWLPFCILLAVWMLGNLARATYVQSSENIWPFSTNVCDNRTLHAQAINSCSSVPYLPPHRGRGSPEIDILEAMYMKEWEHPVLSSSLQVAPGKEGNRPTPGPHLPNVVSLLWSCVMYARQLSAMTALIA